MFSIWERNNGLFHPALAARMARADDQQFGFEEEWETASDSSSDGWYASTTCSEFPGYELLEPESEVAMPLPPTSIFNNTKQGIIKNLGTSHGGGINSHH